MRHEVTVKIHSKFRKKLTRLPSRATTIVIKGKGKGVP